MLTNSNLLNFIGLYDFDMKAGCGESGTWNLFFGFITLGSTRGNNFTINGNKVFRIYK
jgi:hypothetical protein